MSTVLSLQSVILKRCVRVRGGPTHGAEGCDCYLLGYCMPGGCKLKRDFLEKERRKENAAQKKKTKKYEKY
jgi:hypothetical protein